MVKDALVVRVPTEVGVHTVSVQYAKNALRERTVRIESLVQCPHRVVTEHEHVTALPVCSIQRDFQPLRLVPIWIPG